MLLLLYPIYPFERLLKQRGRWVPVDNVYKDPSFRLQLAQSTSNQLATYSS